MGLGPVRPQPLILIADDDPLQRFLHRQALEPAGFAVVEAEDGAQALELFTRCRPDLGVLDVMMPHVDGFAVCRSIRRLPGGRDTPLLIATGLDQVAAIEEAFLAGATDFIGKPISWPVLPHRVRYMLRAHENLANLAISEHRLEEAQRIAGLGHLRWQPGSAMLECSSAVLEMFAIGGDARALPAGVLLRRIPAEDRRRVLRAVRQVLRGASIDLDHRVALPDGALRTVCLRAELLPGEGAAIQVHGSCQDITERKRIEEELRAARDEARTASAAKTAFLLTMSHELRTPLNAILGFSETIALGALGPVAPAKYGEFARAIWGAGRRMLAVFSDVLTMAQLEAGRFDFDFVELDLAMVAAAAVEEFRASELGRERCCELVAPAAVPPVHADRHAVLQMLDNLLSNAAKFSHASTPIRVQIAEVAPRHLRLSVSDDGIGMTAEEAQAAVRPFHQVDGRLARQYQGTGLGLSIVDKLIARHGGRLLIDSAPRRGTCVTLEFPAPPHRAGERLPALAAIAAG